MSALERWTGKDVLPAKPRPPVESKPAPAVDLPASQWRQRLKILATGWVAMWLLIVIVCVVFARHMVPFVDVLLGATVIATILIGSIAADQQARAVRR